jgi:nicotinamidase-related amidase
MAASTLDPRTTALVLIDLQRGIVGRPTAPHSADDVVARAARIAGRFRELGAPVVLVHVAFSPDGADMLRQPVDAPNPPAERPAGWSEIVPELGPKERDLVVTKRQWGAFYGTDLEMQLRRRGILTIVLGGISTNFGVESTARDAWERGYDIVFVEDATTAFTAEAHTFAFTTIFPRLGRVRSTEDLLSNFAKQS